VELSAIFTEFEWIGIQPGIHSESVVRMCSEVCRRVGVRILSRSAIAWSVVKLTLCATKWSDEPRKLQRWAVLKSLIVRLFKCLSRMTPRRHHLHLFFCRLYDSMQLDFNSFVYSCYLASFCVGFFPLMPGMCLGTKRVTHTQFNIF
jgi:hypothetical protein